MQMGQSLSELKTKVLNKIINDEELVKAIIINNESFLDITPTPEQNAILQTPESLIRTQVMPYNNITSRTNKDMTYITSAWVDFKKISKTYKNGLIYFNIIVPNEYEKTDFGIRYDFIADKLDSILSNTNNIGEFQFYERGDIPIDTDHLGHFISFRILDFYGV